MTNNSSTSSYNPQKSRIVGQGLIGIILGLGISMTALTSIPELIKSESSEEIKRTSNQGYIQNSRDSSNDYSELIPKIIGVTGIALSGISLLSIPYRLDRLYNPLNNQL